MPPEPLLRSDRLTPNRTGIACAAYAVDYQHPDFDTLDYATALAQVQNNNAVAAQLGLVGYSPQEMLTPAYSGLTNPAALQAIFDAGVRDVATDVYRPGYANPTPDAGFWIVGSYSGSSYKLLGVPRRMTNLYYDVSTPDQWLAQDHCQWPAGQFGYAAGYSDLLARESSVVLKYMLWGDVDALGFHMLNVRAYDGVHSLMSDLLGQALQRYQALVNFPIVSLTMSGVSTQMANRMAFNAAQPQLSAKVVTTASGSALQISSPVGVTVPVTGLPSPIAHSYGVTAQAELSVAPGGTTTIPLSGTTTIPLSGGTVTLNPVADTYISSSSPTSTAGGASTELWSDFTGSTTAFLRFDLSSLAGRTVTSATLRLETSAESWAGSGVAHNIHYVNDNAWQEQWMSYSNSVAASAIGPSIGTLLGPSPNTWYASTPLDPATIQAHVGSLLSLSMDAPAWDILGFYSRESGQATAPQLVITYR